MNIFNVLHTGHNDLLSKHGTQVRENSLFMHLHYTDPAHWLCNTIPKQDQPQSS